MTGPIPDSRNDPCPCGSGRRYKHCHGAPGAGALVGNPRKSQAADVGQNASASGTAADGTTLEHHPAIQDVEALFHLGNAALQQGDVAAAIQRFESALAGAPSHPGILNNLGLAMERSGDLAGAERMFRRAVAAEPAGFEGLANLAQNLYQQRRYEDALAAYDRLVERFPVGHAAIWANRAVCQCRCGDLDGALSGFRRAIQFAPGVASLHCDVGTLLWAQHRFEEAHEALTRCLELDPANNAATRLLATVQIYLADWNDYANRRKQLLSVATATATVSGQSLESFNVQAVCDDPALELRLARIWMGGLAPAAVATANRAPAHDGRLRLGFASRDFFDHPVGRLVANLLEHIDRARFSVTAYAIGSAHDDAVRNRIALATDQFRDTGRSDAASIARVIQSDGIDILFDLNGFTGPLAEIFALRPAPVQVNFLGYTGTLGLDCYDFIIADRYCIRDEDRDFYVEAPLYVDPCYLPSDATRSVDSAGLRRLDYGLPEDAFVLCAPAAPYKVTPEMFDLWMKVLGSRSDAILWVRGSEPSTMDRLRGEAAKRGADPAKLVFAPHDVNARYLARYRLADLALDTFPFGAHTSVNDALFAGLPVVTLSGNSFASRASASQLRAAGLPGLVAASAGEYVTTVRQLMQDTGSLKALTRQLRQRTGSNALFDTRRYARCFESAVGSAWSSMKHRASR